ncbi:multidrug effflux MFS transporter [Desulfovibrio subterraneus]|uniref:Bcr/CflA family drug resistance efflux transporter n=1 Tax=Desulfovibrio subterraneus TaxID=2718620 RepID=A0A7J0BMP5_9BACT|nr:multidrug effflux MFS transporter [Desulfovibrio subterraneus]GFM34304.1 Bcr/CflA family drug resistance efflux transporter [Desulfovibrio subterraneus]
MPNFVLILLLSAFPALSTDMYLPAIPTLCDLWQISLAQANLSLVVFFISFSACLLVHGPLSDRYGRRPVLLWGISLYVVGCLLCASSTSITMLVFSRIVQAMGAAAASAMSLALAKDLYDGEGRKKLLAYLGVIVPLCPMVAPTIGAFMLSHVSWRGIFLSQAILSLTALYGAFRLTEPLQEKGSGGFSAAVGRYRDLLRNKAYLGYAISFSLLGFPFFAYIASSADIFITGFGMTEQTYGLYFAFNAFALMIGSFLCSRLCVGIASRTILLVSVTGMICSAAAMLYLGGDTPVLFALPMFAYSMFLGMSRPISNHMILEQVQKDAGTASSLLTFFFFICGAIAMETISFNWESKPLAIAVMGLAATITPLIVVIKIRERG